jgi:Trk-type K+ transport system membrane component
MSFLGYSQNCGDHSENDYNAIFQSISDAQNAGNQSDANSLIENAKSMVINDLFYPENQVRAIAYLKNHD